MDKGQVGGRYSYFHTARFFSYYEGSFEYGRLRSLDLRSRLGAGLGRTFAKTGAAELSLRLGGVWVREDYEDPAPDKSYGAASAGIDFQHKLTAGLSFFQKLSADASAEDIRDSLVTSETGLRTMLTRDSASASSRSTGMTTILPKG